MSLLSVPENVCLRPGPAKAGITAVCAALIFAHDAWRPVNGTARLGCSDRQWLRLRGTVTDPDAAIIPGADITLTPASGKTITGKSGSDGTFRVSAPAGVYTMTVVMPGFATMTKPSLKITAGTTVALDVKLVVGDQTTTINVTSDAATVSVDSDSNASSTIIKGADLDALSDDPDELSAELTALAGPSSGPNGGQIYVDGFTGGQLPPKSSIREIRINQNPFSAEYDKLGYGRIEVFTKPGTDKFHGSLSTQGDTKALNTSNPFLGATNDQPSYYTFFLLGNVTGPLTKTSSFSIGGSRRSIQQNAIINPTRFFASSATSTTLCNPGDLTCNSFPFPETERAVLQPQIRQDISPRLDFAFGAKNVLTARYQYEGGNTQNSGIGGNTLQTAGSNVSSNENTIQISDTQTVNSKIVNETRFEYQRADSNQTALLNTASLIVQGIFTGGGSSAQNSNNVSTHIELQNYTSIAMTTHFMRFGGRLRTTGESLTSNSGANGAFVYSYLLDPCTDPGVSNKPSTCSGVTAPCDPSNKGANNGTYFSSYQCGFPSQYQKTDIKTGTVSARQTDVGIYAEDDWKIKPNLTLSYGIRLEAQNALDSSHDFAPRLSIAYGVPRAGGKSSTTVLRGGYGIFYDRFPLSSLLTLQQFGVSGPAQVQTTFLNPGITCGPNNLAGCGNGPGTTPSRTTQYVMAPDLRSSYAMQGAIGVDQQIGRLGTVSVNYLAARGDHEFLTRVFQPATFNQFQLGSGGVYNQQQFRVNANIRTKTLQVFGFWALGFANSNTNGIPTSNTNPHIDYGRAAFNTRSYAVFGGSWSAPFKISASPYLIVRSGQPYNITTGTDVNGDSQFNDRPAFVSGSSANCSVGSTFNTPAQGSIPGSTYNEIPINYCTGPSNFSFNLRLGRTFGFGPMLQGAADSGRNRGGGGGPPGGGMGGPGGGGPGGGGGGGGRGGGGGGRGGGGFGGGSNTGHRYNMTLGASAQNLFNVVPYSTPIGTLSNPRFGTITSIQGRPFSSGTAVRAITLQATFTF